MQKIIFFIFLVSIFTNCNQPTSQVDCPTISQKTINQKCVSISNIKIPSDLFTRGKVCIDKIDTIGFYNSFFDIFKKGIKSSAESNNYRFRLSTKNGNYLITYPLLYKDENLTTSFEILAFDGHFAILKGAITVIVDMQKEKIFAFSPTRVLNPNLFVFYDLYFLDEKLTPYASLAMNNRLEMKPNEIGALYIQLYHYNQKNIIREYTSYKVDKNISNLSYEDMLEYESFIYKKKFEIIKTDTVKNDLYTKIPLWFD